MEQHYQWQGDCLLLHCQLQPRSSRNAIVGTIGAGTREDTHFERLKICITAPPVDGKANKHLIATVAKWFGTAKSQVSIIRGETGRQKTLRIEHPTRFPAEAKINPVD